MKPVVAVILFISFLGKSAPQTLIQSPLSITKDATKSVRFHCEVQGIAISEAIIHWYRQRQGEGLQRLLYFNKQSDQQKDVSDQRLFVEKVIETKSCTLILKTIRASDTGRYLVEGITQSQMSLVSMASKSITITCDLDGASATVVHWYRQPAGQRPVRILYYESGVNNRDDGFEDRFKSRLVVTGQYSLTVDGLKREDSATYFCAYWDTQS